MKKVLVFILILFTALIANCILSMNDDYNKNVEGGSALYIVSGVLIDSAGKGIAGITVQLIGESTVSDITDSSGEYTFENVTNGSYVVTPPNEYRPMPINVEGDDVFVGAVKSGGHGGNENGVYSCSLCHG